MSFRKSSQPLLPAHRQETAPGEYNIYPSFALGEGRIDSGIEAFARQLADSRQVVIDGYPGVVWDELREGLQKALYGLGVRTHWVAMAQAYKSPTEIERLVASSLGDDPLFGHRYPGTLLDFFATNLFPTLRPSAEADLNILYGCGAALLGWQGTLVYVDLPKNEIQFRQRAKSITALGGPQPLAPKAAYKRSYFVDWVVANRHKRNLYQRVDWVVDGQRPKAITFMRGRDLRVGLERLANGYVRTRPWFEPGAWGGQWLQQHIAQLSEDEPNYAWSFELIAPENGIVFESDEWLLEVSFDWLMYRNADDMTGDSARYFGDEFPIRFDFLDTVAGGNLPLQCHPRPEYIRQNFGERFTQDECYYMLDCSPTARCYLGFQENINAREFRQALDFSAQEERPLDVDRYAQALSVARHDLLLIPHGTLHGAGVNNLVLEIGATPYLFTFNLYDWQRPDLNGHPSPLNIERAFENLYFDRQGESVGRELIAKARMVKNGLDWQLIHLPTHRQHFYDVQRYEFSSQVDVRTDGSCQVMSLVEGQTVLLELASGVRQRFNFAETFMVPAAAGSYRLISEDRKPLKVIKSFVKPPSQWVEGVV